MRGKKSDGVFASIASYRVWFPCIVRDASDGKLKIALPGDVIQYVRRYRHSGEVLKLLFRRRECLD